MKTEIEKIKARATKRINKNKDLISRFRADKRLDKVRVKIAVFTLQEANRQIKTILAL